MGRSVWALGQEEWEFRRSGMGGHPLYKHKFIPNSKQKQISSSKSSL